MPAHPHTGPGAEGGGGWPMQATAQPWHAEGRPSLTGALRCPTDPCGMALSKADAVEAERSERLRAFAEDRQVSVVGEQAIATATRDLPCDAELHQSLYRLAGRRKAQATQLLELLGAG